jgi:hypothetical protein
MLALPKDTAFKSSFVVSSEIAEQILYKKLAKI